ncbi:MAG: hypothetical protein AAFU85_00940 [Planctomycetota bacterium]
MIRAVKSILTIVIGTLVLLPLAIIALGAAGYRTEPILRRSIEALPASFTSTIGFSASDSGMVGHWPPIKGQPFPEVVLHDQNGEPTRLRDFAGKLILVEYAAIPCEGCQAFAGGQTHGGFAGFPVQSGLQSIEHYAAQFGGVELGNEDIVFVQVILYGKSVSAPTQEEVTAWAEHFQMDRASHQLVLRATPGMLGREAFDLIPGFQLIDRDFIVRSDSCGHQPADNLYSDLLPLLGRLARER